MENTYYNPDDLKKFGDIGEFQKDYADKFFEWYGAVFSEGASRKRKKVLLH